MSKAEHGTCEPPSTRADGNGFVNRRPTVQSRPPAPGSENQEAEEWRPIPGFEDWYEASSLGRVRRRDQDGNSDKDRILHPGRDHKNHRHYLGVLLCVGGQPISRKVHRLVAAAFLGEPPPGHVVNHIDCDRTNNRVSNLEYVTPQENVAHAHRHGRFTGPKGPRLCGICGVNGHNRRTCGRPSLDDILARGKRPANEVRP